jgi:hypothetical protein
MLNGQPVLAHGSDYAAGGVVVGRRLAAHAAVVMAAMMVLGHNRTQGQGADNGGGQDKDTDNFAEISIFHVNPHIMVSSLVIILLVTWLKMNTSVMSRLYCRNRREDRLKPKSFGFWPKLPPPYGGAHPL